MKISYNYCCQKCGAPRTVEVESDGMALVNKHKILLRCPECSYPEKDPVSVAVAPDESDAELKRLIPPKYQQPRTDEFPEAPFKVAQAWKPGKRGLLLYGPTDRHKSFIAYWLVARAVRCHSKAECYDCRTFRAAVESGIKDGWLWEWEKRLQSVPVLLLDDLGKFRGEGKRIEEELFNVVKLRDEAQLGVIITTNLSPDELSRKMSPDIAAPLIRRLVENCQCVSFYYSNEEELTAGTQSSTLRLDL